MCNMTAARTANLEDPMKIIKKSLNLSSDVVQRLDDYIAKNPGLNFTLIANAAIEAWLENPQIKFQKAAPMTQDEIKRFMRENKELMRDLAK